MFENPLRNYDDNKAFWAKNSTKFLDSGHLDFDIDVD